MNVAGCRRKKNRILVIDSDVDDYYRHLVAAVRNCNIIITRNKDEACEFFFHNDVDLVLLNHSPTNHCFELLQVLRFVSPSVPVIIITAYGSEELAVTVFKNGARDYLKKPFSNDDLKNSIEATLGKSAVSRKKGVHQLDDGIQKAIHYINSNYCLPLTLSRVARESGMSVSCLGRTLKKTLSVTFSIYLNKVRIARAIQILEDGLEFTFNEIAYACGYTNQYHFSRMFKKMTKTSPRDFKKALTVGKKPN